VRDKPLSDLALLGVAVSFMVLALAFLVGEMAKLSSRVDIIEGCCRCVDAGIDQP